MDIVEATQDYEGRAGAFATLDRGELAFKHERMAKDGFEFFRATYYRWAKVFPRVLPLEQSAPAVASVGDLHVENFGTWRDVDARPVFGVNDLDEVDVLPYTNDLIRLAASFRLAVGGKNVIVRVKPRDLAAAVLKGYREYLPAGGGPIVLSEPQGALGDLLASLSGRPEEFWNKLRGRMRPLKGEVCRGIREGIAQTAPAGLEFKYHRRVHVGRGSLGRERVVGVAEFQGARVVREAKARVPSATMLGSGSALKRGGELVGRILSCETRAADPSLRVFDQWVIRRLAPDAVKLDLAALQNAGDWVQLAGAMGREVANIHLVGGRKDGKKILTDLRRRRGMWLNEAAKQMVLACNEDWRVWRRSRRR